MTSGRGCVLDASAVLALFQGEPGADTVERAAEGSSLSAVNWSEVCQRHLAHGVSTEGLRRDVQALGVRIVPFSLDDAEGAAALWPSTRHLGLSLGDRACLALALRLGLPALTADRSWLGLELAVEIRAIR